MVWNRKHVFGLDGWSKEEIMTTFNQTKKYKEALLKRPAENFDCLKGYTVMNMFFENSTRTRSSFEMAEQRLGAHVVNFSVSTSSVNKGETIIDTIRNIDVMNVDAIVVRHTVTGTPQVVAENSHACVLNAGDGVHEHPTQGLLDIYTLWEKVQSFEGLKVCILGDILHSRVARSNLFGLLTLGADVTLCGPPTLVPKYFEELGAKVTWDLDSILDKMDVFNILRIQKERMEKAFFPSISEYVKVWGMTEEKLARCKKDVIIMHPGPTNREVEIAASVADGDRSVILEQVTNGEAVRMALLQLCLRGEM